MDSSRWWNAETVAVVTGANKGIGLAVCKHLAEKGLKVILTARNESRGRTAADNLKEQGLLNIVFHQLDVQDEQSIASFASWLLKEHGGLDILINNAAVLGIVINHEYIKENNIDLTNIRLSTLSTKAFIVGYETAKSCLDANYYGVKKVTKALIPQFRSSLGGARIINIGSDYGQLCHIPSEEIRKKFDDVSDCSEGDLDNLVDKYLEDVKSKRWEQSGWPLKLPSYKVSKIALHAYTRILAKDLDKRPLHQRIFVNCVHPGFVRTDLTSFLGNMTPAEGALNVVRVALLPPQGCPSGEFFYEGSLSNF